MRKKEASSWPNGAPSSAYGSWFTLAAEVARLEALGSIQQEVATSGAPLPALMTLVASRAQDLTGASGAVIAMPDEQDLVCRSATGAASGHLRARIPQLGTIVGRAFRSGDAVLCEETSSAGESDPDILADVGVRSMVAVALVSSKTSLGVLAALSQTPGAFTGQHVQTLRLISGILAARLDLAAELQAKQALLAENTIAIGALRESESRFRRAFDDSGIGMGLVALDGRWLKVNAALSRITGYSERDLLGRTLQAITHPDDLEGELAFVRQLLAGEISTYENETRYINRNGSTVWVLLTASVVNGATGAPMYFVVQVQDITDRKRAHETLWRLATRDELTGLYNRREMDRLLAEEIVRGSRHGRPLSLLLIDLDRFKEVNDTFGHAVGDVVLQAVSATVCESVRSLDRVARYGGEELAVILPETSEEQAMVVAERIRTRVAQRAVELEPPRHENRPDSVSVTISIGVGCSSNLEELTAERLLTSADQGLYAAKRAGRNCSMKDIDRS
jgi:diguanylate cyclase (GGDEF)-like protein/PAS domain S-box-containing protein